MYQIDILICRALGAAPGHLVLILFVASGVRGAADERKLDLSPSLRVSENCSRKDSSGGRYTVFTRCIRSTSFDHLYPLRYFVKEKMSWSTRASCFRPGIFSTVRLNAANLPNFGILDVTEYCASGHVLDDQLLVQV